MICMDDRQNPRDLPVLVVGEETMGIRFKHVSVISGCAGGRDRVAEVNIKVLGESDTIEGVRLMVAAAPELLSFAVQYLYSECGECRPSHDAAPYTREDLVDMAREVIALATDSSRD